MFLLEWGGQEESMSRAFVQGDRADQSSDETVPERTHSENPNYVTPRGLKALQQRLACLEAERQTIRAIDDESRRKREIARIDRDLAYVRSRVESAIPVDQSHLCEHEVHFGSEVTVVDEDGREATYIIVGEDEADPARGLISWASPLASALTNARQGEAVTWKRPAGDKELTILRVRNAQLDEP
jgi:transcription elongation factor GreB